MNIRSIEELEDFISKEHSWRRKELTNLRNIALASKHRLKSSLLRSNVPVLYAHWEGFVKKCSVAYCKFLNHKMIKYEEMRLSFHAFAVLNHFQGQFPHTRFDSYMAIVDQQTIKLDRIFVVDAEKYIDTKSNLNYDVLKDIASKLGLNHSLYELKENFINKEFIGLRNAIAHGEYKEVTEENFELLYNEVTTLITIFRNEVLNSAVQSKYLVGK